MAQTAQQIENLSDGELQGEYVSGGGYYTSQTLSLESVDRIRPGLTAQTRSQLRYDSEVESSVEFLLDAVFSDGLQPVSAITDDEAEDYIEAGDIANFIAVATSTDAPRTLAAVVREVAREAFYSGVKAGEIVLKVDDENNLILDRINPKPNSAVSFVCDRHNNVLGLTSWNRNYSATEITEKKEEIIAREKFLIIQFEMEDNDPRGVVKIKAAYDDWCDKKLTREQWKEWRRTSAIPKKFGITDPNAAPRKLFDRDGKPLMKGNMPVTVSAEKDLMNALEGYANNSTVTAPHGTTIGQLEIDGTGEQFVKALKYNNSGIRKAILGDSVTTGEDDKGIKGAKEVAMNVVDLRVKSTKNTIADAVRRDVYRLLTVVNFGADKAYLTPYCSLGDTERRDWATDLDAATSAGYQFADEHLPELDVQFGQKPRKFQQKIETEPNKGNKNDTRQEGEGEAE